VSALASGQVRTSHSDAIDQVLAGIDHPGEPGGIVAVVHHGRTIHLVGYGLANLEAGSPWSPATLYDIASITKTLVAQAVVRLADEGELDLGADIRDLVPSLGKLPAAVTVRHALSMRSGIRADEEIAWLAGKNGWVDEQFLHDLIARQRSLQFVPGTWQTYSDSNYRILARVIAAVRGRTYADAMRALIFDPLGLHATSIVPYDWIVSSGLATYYLRCGSGWSRRPYGYESSGDGAVRTSMSDVLRWLRLTLHDDHAGVPSIERLTQEGGSVPEMPYRYGVVVDSYKGHRRWQHSGASGTMYAHLPDAELTIVAFVNRADRPPGDVVDDVADAVLGERTPAMPHHEPVRRTRWSPGTWVDPTTGYPVIVAPGGSLSMLGASGTIEEVDGSPSAHFGEAPLPLNTDHRGALIADLGHGPVPLQLREQGPMPNDVVGTYRSDELGSDISIDPGPEASQLVLGGGQNPELRVELSWFGDDVAVGENLGLKVIREQEVSAILLSTWGARLVRFERCSDDGR